MDQLSLCSLLTTLYILEYCVNSLKTVKCLGTILVDKNHRTQSDALAMSNKSVGKMGFVLFNLSTSVSLGEDFEVYNIKYQY